MERQSTHIRQSALQQPRGIWYCKQPLLQISYDLTEFHSIVQIKILIKQQRQVQVNEGTSCCPGTHQQRVTAVACSCIGRNKTELSPKNTIIRSLNFLCTSPQTPPTVHNLKKFLWICAFLCYLFVIFGWLSRRSLIALIDLRSNHDEAVSMRSQVICIVKKCVHDLGWNPWIGLEVLLIATLIHTI